MIDISSNPKLYNPLTLAFLGDSVFELLAREQVVAAGSMSPGKLHRAAVRFVCADAQARLYDLIEPVLTEEELAMLLRGRNATSVTPPKNADPAHYRKATAVETLFGYLHLCGRFDRERELFAYAGQAAG